MTDSFTAATGRKVLSRASAEELGKLTQLLVDVGDRRVAQLVVGKGRRARSVDWEHVTGFGPDAVMLDDAASLVTRDATTAGADLLGQRALSELGNELGWVDDVIFDPTTGAILSLVVGTRAHAAGGPPGAAPSAGWLGGAPPAPATADADADAD